MVGFLEARLGPMALMMGCSTGIRTSPTRGMMLLNTSNAWRFTLLFLSVSLGVKTSNT